MTPSYDIQYAWSQLPSIAVADVLGSYGIVVRRTGVRAQIRDRVRSRSTVRALLAGWAFTALPTRERERIR